MYVPPLSSVDVGFSWCRVCADVPEGWYHATVNLDETIAIAGQSFVKGPVTKELQLSLRWAMTQQYDDLLRLERFHLDQLQTKNQREEASVLSADPGPSWLCHLC